MNLQPLLDQYLDNLDNLSPDLIRNFKLIQDLDSRVRDILIHIDELKDIYLKSYKSYDQETRLTKVKEIDEQYEKCKQYSDEKVQLANQTYELVDKYICKLDTDLSRFEGELNQNSSKEDIQNKTATINEVNKEAKSDEDPNLRKKKKKLDKSKIKKEDTEPVLTNGTNVIGNQEIQISDMPVDPNEPVYCLCKQVSFGEMIGCDNPDCEIEWFHFQCVGLNDSKQVRTQKWYCPLCTEKRKG